MLQSLKSNILILFFIISFAILLFIFHGLFYNMERNFCAMTWMYEEPEYLKVNVPLDNKYKHLGEYSMYLYGEGVYASNIQSLKLSGIPVLFIPGNSGSYKQVRSLASVALRKAEKLEDSSLHFNYFTLDFKEEFSAFYGGCLLRQIQFAKVALAVIVDLYKELGVFKPEVIVIGHSMGGIVARSLFHRLNPNIVYIQLLITLATPHYEPIIPLNSDLVDLYKMLDDITISVPVITISGSTRDIQVHPRYAFLDKKYGVSKITNLPSVSVPQVWRSCDHQCIVWCNELIITINRLLFKIHSSQEKDRLSAVKDSIHQYFSDSTGFIHSNAQIFHQTVRKKISCTLRSILLNNTYIITRSLRDDCIEIPQHTEIDILLNPSDNNAIFLCYDVISGECKNPIEITKDTLLLPGYYRYLNIKQNERKIYLVMKKAEGKIIVSTSEMKSQLVYSAKSVLKSKSRHFIFTVDLPYLTSLWHVYTASVTSRKCLDANAYIFAYSSIPWNSENRTTYFLPNSLNHTIKLDSYRPKTLSQSINPRLIIFSTSKCHINVEIKYDIQHSIVNSFRYHAQDIYTCIVALILLYGTILFIDMGKNSFLYPIIFFYSIITLTLKDLLGYGNTPLIATLLTTLISIGPGIILTQGLYYFCYFANYCKQKIYEKDLNCSQSTAAWLMAEMSVYCVLAYISQGSLALLACIVFNSTYAIHNDQQKESNQQRFGLLLIVFVSFITAIPNAVGAVFELKSGKLMATNNHTLSGAIISIVYSINEYSKSSQLNQLAVCYLVLISITYLIGILDLYRFGEAIAFAFVIGIILPKSHTK